MKIKEKLLSCIMIQLVSLRQPQNLHLVLKKVAVQIECKAVNLQIIEGDFHLENSILILKLNLLQGKI